MKEIYSSGNQGRAETWGIDL